MRALVIGGTGPTGPFIVRGLLKRGYEVAMLHRGTHEVDLPPEVEHLHGDPHFVETLEQTLGSRTFDLAVVTYGRLRYAAEVLKGRTPRLIAVGGTPYLAIVEGFRNIAGSPVPLSEDAPLCTDEAVNKFTYLMMVTEQAVMQGHEQGHYNATFFRYPIIYGPRALAPAEWSIIRRILEGRPRIIIPNDGLKLQSRGYAENMAHALLLAVDKPEVSAGRVYNVADERVLSTREWVCTIAGIMGHQWEMVSIPFELARPSRPYAGRAHHQVIDITRVQSELGYRDVVPAEEGIRQTIMWLLENRPGSGGEEEKQLGERFDYATEDRLIESFQEFSRRAREEAEVGFQYRHPYAHPKQSNDS